MAAVFEQAKGGGGRTWECKQCHKEVPENDTVAYHLVEGVLYGWCEVCFRDRVRPNTELAA